MVTGEAGLKNTGLLDLWSQASPEPLPHLKVCSGVTRALFLDVCVFWSKQSSWYPGVFLRPREQDEACDG